MSSTSPPHPYAAARSPHACRLLDLPGELYAEICQHLRPGGRWQEQRCSPQNNEEEDEEEEEDDGKGGEGEVMGGRCRHRQAPPPPFSARAHRDVSAFASCCRAIRATRPDLVTATRRRLTVPLSLLSPSPFVLHTDAARSPFFAFFQQRRSATPELHDIVVRLDCPESWVGRMLQLLLQLERSGAGSRLRRLEIVVVVDDVIVSANNKQQPTTMMKTTDDMLRRLGAQLRRAAPRLEELRVDKLLNLTYAFYDGLFPPISSCSSSSERRQQQQQQAPPRVFRPRALDVGGLGERFPDALADGRQGLFLARLESLALTHGLRPGHGLGVSALLAHAPALAEVRLGSLIPGVRWDACWPPGLRRISVRRMYDCDIGALEALAGCGPSLRHLEFDVFYVHRPSLAWTLARVARRLRDAQGTRVSARTLAYDGAFYDEGDEAEAADVAAEEEEEEEEGEIDVVHQMEWEPPLHPPAGNVGVVPLPIPNAPETLSVARLLNEGLTDTLHMLRANDFIRGEAIQLDRITVDAASMERLARCVPDTVELSVCACSPVTVRSRRRDDQQDRDDPLCVAVTRFPRLRRLSFQHARPLTTTQLIDAGVRVISAAFRARAPLDASSPGFPSFQVSASQDLPPPPSPPRGPLPLDIWIWSNNGDKEGDDSSSCSSSRSVTRAWAAGLEARGLPVRTCRHLSASTTTTARNDAQAQPRIGIVRPHLMRGSLPFHPPLPKDSDAISMFTS